MSDGALLLVERVARALGPLRERVFRDRGAADPFVSKDLEDVFALPRVAPPIPAEVGEAPGELREFVAAAATSLLARADIDDLLTGHLANVARSRARDAIHPRG